MTLTLQFRKHRVFCLLGVAFFVLSSGLLRAEPIRRGPKPLKPAAHGIGRLVRAFSFSDINGEQHAFGSEHTAQLTAFCFTSTSLSLIHI